MYRNVLGRLLLTVVFITMGLSQTCAQASHGKASYYAKHFNGRRTASGERLHPDSMTCAHRNYPFGTRLKVTNVKTGKSIVVRVNDRGPFVKGRIIDLSYIAAKELGIISQGIATVTVEPYTDEVQIPLKDDRKLELPELDLDMNVPADPNEPVWKPHDEGVEKNNKPEDATPEENKKNP